MAWGGWAQSEVGGIAWAFFSGVAFSLGVAFFLGEAFALGVAVFLGEAFPLGVAWRQHICAPAICCLFIIDS
eukprot:7944837-Pyramimonas_sp.AAC.1